MRVQILLLLLSLALSAEELPIMAESTKELTDEGAKVTTTVEGSDATAAAPAEPARRATGLGQCGTQPAASMRGQI